MFEKPNQPPQLRSAEIVHRRALALAYVVCRAMIDVDPNPNAKKMSEMILFFINGVGLTPDLLPHELRMLNTPFGKLKLDECASTSWLSEGMVTLAWALGLADLPDPRTKCHPGPPSMGLGMFRPGTKERLSQAALRDPAEIDMKFSTYLSFNWRIGHFVLHPEEKMDFIARLKDPNSPHLLVDELEFIDDDVAIDGMPLANVPHDRAGEVAFIVRERFNAFKWLQGYSEQYSTEVPVQ
ncbi:MAG TPA: DUF4272 domain-containing protein [Terracidiphilus sp.]|jgi:hypothetical protein